MRALDRALEAIVRAAMGLVLPLSLLLFAQWPLRDVVQGHSREANDLAQILFALYVSVAITAATRSRAHLAVTVLSQRYPRKVREWLYRVAALAILAPWSAFVIATCAQPVWQSLLQMERFADTLNPGYFLIRFAAMGLAALVFAQALLDAFAATRAAAE
jgi:TRAP-type C4-dicarboxylate transport system permease small subunit